MAAFHAERIQKAILWDSGGLVPFAFKGQLLGGITALSYRGFPNKKCLRRATKLFYAPGVDINSGFDELLGLGYRHVRFDVDMKGVPPVRAEQLEQLTDCVLVVFGEHDVFFNAHKACSVAREVVPNLWSANVIENEGHVFSQRGKGLFYRDVEGFIES